MTITNLISILSIILLLVLIIITAKGRLGEKVRRHQPEDLPQRVFVFATQMTLPLSLLTLWGLVGNKGEYYIGII